MATISPAARAVVASINKKYGDGSLLIASEIAPVTPFTTGSLSVDAMLAGGFPANQWSEVIGKESAGKTSFVHKSVAANQAANPDFTTLWIGAEGYEPAWASKLGVDVERVVWLPTQVMEEAYEVMLEAMASKEFDCIVLDSYPALVTNVEDKKDMEDVTVALGARYTGKFFRKAGKAGRRAPGERPWFGVFINQFRADIGGFSPHGTPLTTPGGNAKNYAFYSRLKITKKEDILAEGTEGVKARVGHTMNFLTVKSKVSPPGQTMSVDFYVKDTADGFKCGDYDIAKEMMALSVYHGVIHRAGRFFSYGGQRWGSKDECLAAIRENEPMRQLIRDEILVAVSLRG